MFKLLNPRKPYFLGEFISKPLFTQKEKLNVKTYNSTLLKIYRISVWKKIITLKENIIILKYAHK